MIVEILASKLNGPVARTDLEAWINTYHLPVTTVMDPPGSGTTSLNTYGIRESLFIVDLSTMRIVTKINGSVTGSGMSSVGQAVPMMHALLGR